MKNLPGILCLMLLTGNHLYSQSLTYTNFLKSLSLTQHVILADKNTFNTGLLTITGNGVTWDASGIKQQTGTPAINFIYGDPSLTPNGALFPSSNYAQYDPLLTSVLGYNYYQLTNDSFVSWGDYQPSTQHEIFQNPDKRLVFPFSFGNTFVDDYAKTNYSDATTISSYQTGTRTVIFSGFGTLVLPQGSFNNVGLVSELRTNSLGPNSTEFTWFNLDDGRQLMYYAENNGKITIFYSTDSPSGMADNDLNQKLMIFPDPVSEKLHIINSSENFDYQIFDLNGRLIKIGYTENSEITTNNIPAGLYILNLFNNENYHCFKVNMSH
ncbi:MAG TPA: T9SS type A sorting domain-containing protein [Bacteroidia bacterium]|nr:T9SS type A sorting domain-containing protein [Bacteroidia bacterium]HRS57636.1 T9SS type A sorting domain-containing protein [Bacteroidia bacterium]HRU68923.1 T9SS type A sorting domain-containing protein [Bacteroidia bacterium]